MLHFFSISVRPNHATKETKNGKPSYSAWFRSTSSTWPSSSGSVSYPAYSSHQATAISSNAQSISIVSRPLSFIEYHYCHCSSQGPTGHWLRAYQQLFIRTPNTVCPRPCASSCPCFKFRAGNLPVSVSEPS